MIVTADVSAAVTVTATAIAIEGVTVTEDVAVKETEGVIEGVSARVSEVVTVGGVTSAAISHSSGPLGPLHSPVFLRVVASLSA